MYTNFNNKATFLFFLINILGSICVNGSKNNFNTIKKPNFTNTDSAIASSILVRFKNDITSTDAFKLIDSLSNCSNMNNAGMISYFYMLSNCDGATAELMSSCIFKKFSENPSSFKQLFFTLCYYNDTSSIKGLKYDILFELNITLMQDDPINKTKKLLNEKFTKLLVNCNKNELEMLENFKQSIIVDLDEVVKNK